MLLKKHAKFKKNVISNIFQHSYCTGRMIALFAMLKPPVEGVSEHVFAVCLDHLITGLLEGILDHCEASQVLPHFGKQVHSVEIWQICRMGRSGVLFGANISLSHRKNLPLLTISGILS